MRRELRSICDAFSCLTQFIRVKVAGYIDPVRALLCVDRCSLSRRSMRGGLLPHTVASVGFGLVQGLICAQQDVIQRLSIRGVTHMQTHTDGDGPCFLCVVNEDCAAHRLAQPICQQVGVRRVGVGAGNDEFLSAIAPDNVVRAHMGLQ